MGSGTIWLWTIRRPSSSARAKFVAAQHLGGTYEEALWATVSALGDRDTTCAIVGGVVLLRSGVEGIPGAWRAAREALPI